MGQMANLTTAQVEADVDLLMDCLGAKYREIPSTASLLKRSSALPLFAVALSVLSNFVFYYSFYKEDATISGFLSFFVSEGWYLIAITAVIGLFVFFMAYNNQLTYLSLPLISETNL
jgi:hypothetical protein